MASGSLSSIDPPRRTHDAALVALAETSDDFQRLIKDRDRDDLLRPSEDGGWGVVEILAHLRDWEEVFLERIRLTLERDQPLLPRYDDDLWPIERDYRGQDPVATLAAFRATRETVLATLRELPPEAWGRTAIHPRYGTVSIQWLADHIESHDQEHLEHAKDALA